MYLTLVPEAGFQEVIEHAGRAPLLVFQHPAGNPHQQAVAVGRAKGRADLLGNHLGDGQPVLLAEVVEEAHSVVLDHGAV